MAAERTRSLPAKEGVEIAQGLLLSFVLASPRCGAHLVWSMLRPTEEALARLDDFRATGVADLGRTYLERRGKCAYIEIRNDRHLNAEDCDTLPTTEVAVDLALLDPAIEVGVMRGAVVSHPRYAGRRIFGAGLNLTHLYHGRLDYLFFVTRDLGYVNKLFRGLSTDEHHPGEPEDDREALGRRSRDLCDRRRVPDPARGRPCDRDEGDAALPARAQGGDPARRVQPAARALGWRPPRAPGDPVGARVRGGDAARRPPVRRGRRVVRGDGRRGRRARRRPHEAPGS